MNLSRTQRLAQALFALLMIGFGSLGLAKGAYAPIGTGVPQSVPGHEWLPYLCALVSVGCGIGLLSRRRAGIAAAGLVGFLVLWLVTVRVVGVVEAPAETGSWWSVGQTTVMLAVAWVLYTWNSTDASGQLSRTLLGRNAARIAAGLYGLGLVPWGLAHFSYFDRTVSMVPIWLPWPQGWAWFTGGAFVVAGLAIVTGIRARLASILVAWEIGLLTVLVWIPVVAAGSVTQFNWQEVVISIVLTLVATIWALAYRNGSRLERSYPEVPEFEQAR